MESTRWALALLNVDGLGRVGVRRLLRSFRSWEQLVAYPHEQVLARLKGIPRGAEIVDRLRDQRYMSDRLAAADDIVSSAEASRVRIVAAEGSGWPKKIDDLPSQHCPIVLYLFGEPAVLDRPSVSFVGDERVGDAQVEKARRLAAYISAHNLGAVTGGASKLDGTLQAVCAERSSTPNVMVSHCGFTRLSRDVRPTVTRVVQDGGIILSPFAMGHGPYPHDHVDRAYLQAAVSSAVVFVSPRPATPEWDIMRWTQQSRRSVFAIFDSPDEDSTMAHPIRDDIDFEWVLEAALETF